MLPPSVALLERGLAIVLERQGVSSNPPSKLRRQDKDDLDIWRECRDSWGRKICMRAVPPIHACVLALAIQTLRRVFDLVIAAVGRGRAHDKRRGIWHIRDRRPLLLANGRRFSATRAEHELGYRRDNDVP